ncbi:bile acid:sodium symporter family protein [Halococcus saccharolyticus]|uniref:Transmembrane transport protein n=1 Tax=Halococcus saccharolyticus DSM 5350 TaxID=1227455 RepID=M0MNT8_9EURY|nr:bile acid:sodium symporter [Halococcus saccharolyticus]EMA47377.1 transmembrane transport protein [Halococcus saccharolyticus DSM 5350]
MPVVLESLARLAVLVFVVASMLAMGLSLTLDQIVTPLRNTRRVAKALLANFVVVPLVAFGILLVVPLSEPQSIGLVLLATAAGAPFLPTLVQAAKGDVAFGVGLMVLLMVVTVAYVPLVLPLLLPGVEVNPLDIASSLVVLMLLPLAAGLVIRSRYAGVASTLQPTMAQTASTSLVLLMVLMLVLNFENIVGVIGTGLIVALLVLVVLSLAAGYVLGGPTVETRSVVGLGTAQRNISAALVVGAGNFTDPDVIVTLLVGALMMLAVLLVVGGELGKRTDRSNSTRMTEEVVSDD